ncbi:ATP-binding protein [Emcibacter sp. SYSU 3D8]|uniref:ATP-binding protein n=1 Tax=Emcibacter sp. SYSU 3D8 TaxID=3133969 RepID=UPI0031FE56CF
MIPRNWAEAGKVFLVALACAAIAAFSHLFSIASIVPPATWWPLGIALGGLIVLGRVAWPGVFLGWLAGALIAGLGPAAAISAGTGTAAALGGAWLAARLRLGTGLDRFRDVGLLMAVIVPATALVAALGDALLFLVPELSPTAADPGDAILGRWLGCVFSGFAFVPLLMGMNQSTAIATRPLRWLEFAGILGIKALTAALINTPALPNSVQLALVVSQFPLLAWMAVRFNLLGVGILIAVSLVFAQFGTAQGAGPLHGFTIGGQWTTLTSFCTLSTLTALLLYAAMEAMRRMQREVIASERRLRDIADSASDFFFETDAMGRLQYVSERFAEFVGSQTELLLGRVAFMDEVTSATEPDWPILLEHIRQHESYRNMRVPVTTMSGERKVLMASGKPIFDDHGLFVGYRGACSDITEQIDAADALFQAQKMESVGQLTGGLAHDFNNLLAVIIGNMELAEETLAEAPGASKSLLRKALNAAERGALLIQRLLAFSRRQALSPKVVDVNALLLGLSDILDHALGDGIRLRRDLTREPWLVRVDPTQLESVILNMAINARDAMPLGGDLTIVTRNDCFAEETMAGKDSLPAGDYVTITVSDTGTGMPPDVLDRIFEPFFTTKDTGRGSGLGLSMAYGFVRQSGGAIEARSEPGEGTRLTFYLPRHRDETGAVASTRNAAAGPPGYGERIMLVEDDAAVRDLLVRRLSGMGYEVVPVDNAVKALKMLRETSAVDLLLTDVVLPGGLYGDKLAEQARALRPGLKVLFMSGYPKNATDKMGQIGLDDPVLRKPFRNQELAAQLRQLLDRAEENA